MSLRDRLRRARETGSGKASPEARKPRPTTEGIPGFLAGWKIEGGLATRVTRYDIDFPDEIDLRPFRARGDAVTPDRAAKSDFSFFDLETTGLSGGAGTVAFLAAFGRFEGKALLVRQYFMRDYPDEPAFLERCRVELDSSTVLASYNGRTFDEPLLRTRFVVNRMRPVSGPHVDALHAARRLWRKRLPDCSLGTVEAALGRERGRDIPGELVPEVWFEYLRRGDDDRMGLVLSHNAEDVASLAAVVASAFDAFANPLARADVDLGGIGRKMLQYDPARAEPVLRAAFRAGCADAAWPLYRLLAREGRTAEADRVLAAMEPSFEAWSLRSGKAERVERDFAKALALAEQARAEATTESRVLAVERRIDRLRRKIEAAASSRGEDAASEKSKAAASCKGKAAAPKLSSACRRVRRR